MYYRKHYQNFFLPLYTHQRDIYNIRLSEYLSTIIMVRFFSVTRRLAVTLPMICYQLSLYSFTFFMYLNILSNIYYYNGSISMNNTSVRLSLHRQYHFLRWRTFSGQGCMICESNIIYENVSYLNVYKKFADLSCGCSRYARRYSCDNIHIPPVVPSTPSSRSFHKEMNKDEVGRFHIRRKSHSGPRLSISTQRSRLSVPSMPSIQRLMYISYNYLVRVRSAGVDVIEINIPVTIGSRPLMETVTRQTELRGYYFLPKKRNLKQYQLKTIQIQSLRTVNMFWKAIMNFLRHQEEYRTKKSSGRPSKLNDREKRKILRTTSSSTTRINEIEKVRLLRVFINTPINSLFRI
uniref:Uncharacterized protein n=1 Tax=Heterorhabditis bacteriophora TaxID=37862 RepID=A0A1I7X1B3_HETBA